uniref:(northern house mosquito) hypothetical protein n=1 Tax=Culex pipiens TaxID=7175 RepID=A0A8D8I5M2_CULPI
MWIEFKKNLLHLDQVKILLQQTCRTLHDFLDLRRTHPAGFTTPTGVLALPMLMKRVAKVKMFAYTDSTIVLHQLAIHPRELDTYVAILEELPRSRWFHVESVENPASRGILSA